MYTLARMSRETARQMKLPPHQEVQLVRLDHGKGNYSAIDPSKHWFELVPVPIGNGSDAGDGFVVDGDTVAVPVPWKPVVMEAEVTEGSARKGDPKETQKQRVRNFIAETMQTDRVELSKLIGQVQSEFGVGKSAARMRVMKAVEDGSTSFAQANGVLYHLTIERDEPSPPKPAFVVRTVVKPDEATDDIAGVTSVGVDTRECQSPTLGEKC
jgi:hypothetical protein